NERKCVCQKCGYAELMSRAVLRSIKEFKVLFPNEKITTNIIHDWCKVVKSKRRIRNVLRSNFDNVGVRQWTYYE
ncbi:MAG TPA: NERD domain-containing protein, partial [Virgibacillus sp.]|nr:NERD domain-containing protein [Virgibacillus sp.]